MNASRPSTSSPGPSSAPSPARPRGVFVAALTPLTSTGDPDLEATAAHYRWLLDQGCDGIVCLGTTGEANSFTLDERLALLDHLGASGLAGRLIVGTGCCAIGDTVRLTRKALEIGAPGVLVLPPFYYKGVPDDGLFAAYAETIERVGDARLRLYIYHFPKMTGLDIGLPLIERLIAAYPDTVVGLKNSSGDWDNIRAMIDAFPGFDVFAGSEEFLLPTLRLGGPGCMSATLNVLAPQAVELAANWQSPEAEATQERLSALRRAISAAAAPIPAMKAMLARHTGRSTWRAVRPPLCPLDPAQEERLSHSLAALGFDLPAAA
ncbi:MAG: dihydrodipicolinate synthase family protein [Alphaproteobacteria bacterium]|nr:MAG: dihydrodipicolinate synthase family protein [Alphaproteobacteria bacterium]